MFIDKDGWGNYSIQELTNKELKLLRAALQAYIQCNFGHVDKLTGYEFGNLTGNSIV